MDPGQCQALTQPPAALSRLQDLPEPSGTARGLGAPLSRLGIHMSEGRHAAGASTPSVSMLRIDPPPPDALARWGRICRLKILPSAEGAVRGRWIAARPRDGGGRAVRRAAPRDVRIPQRSRGTSGIRCGAWDFRRSEAEPPYLTAEFAEKTQRFAETPHPPRISAPSLRSPRFMGRSPPAGRRPILAPRGPRSSIHQGNEPVPGLGSALNTAHPRLRGDERM
jgi:hypothetical protein